MTDLYHRLDRLAGPTHPVTEAEAAADLARGHRALKRRRTLKAAATGVFAAAAVAAVTVYGTGGSPGDRSWPSTAAPQRATGPSTAAVATATLVDYHGRQPKGYTIDKVPAGWEVQGNDPSVLTIAPIDARDRDPHSWIGKIAIMLRSKDDRSTPVGAAVTVGGKPGVLSTDRTSTTRTLFVKQPSGVYLVIQIWDARGWSDEAITAFGGGVHVLADARQGIG